MFVNKKVLGSFPDLRLSFWVYILYQVQRHAHVCRFMHSAEWTCESLVWKHCCDRNPPKYCNHTSRFVCMNNESFRWAWACDSCVREVKKQYTPAAILSFPPSILYISVCASPSILTHTHRHMLHPLMSIFWSLSADAAAVFMVTWLLSIFTLNEQIII